MDLLRVRSDLVLNQHIFEWMIEMRAKVDPKNGACRLAHHFLAKQLGLHPPRASLDCLLGFRRSAEELAYKNAVNECLEQLMVAPVYDPQYIETIGEEKAKMFTFKMPSNDDIHGEPDKVRQSILRKIKGIGRTRWLDMRIGDKKQKQPPGTHSELLHNCLHRMVGIIKVKSDAQYEEDSKEGSTEFKVYGSFLYATDTESESDTNQNSNKEMCTRIMASLYAPANENETWSWSEDEAKKEKLAAQLRSAKPMLTGIRARAWMEGVIDTTETSSSSDALDEEKSLHSDNPDTIMDDESQMSAILMTADLALDDADESKKKRMLTDQKEEPADKRKKSL